MVTLVLDPVFGINKEQLQSELSGLNIDCRPCFYPLSSLPAYATHPMAERARERNRISYELSPLAINLPSGLNMTREKVEYVCTSVKKILLRQRRDSNQRCIVDVLAANE